MDRQAVRNIFLKLAKNMQIRFQKKKSYLMILYLTLFLVQHVLYGSVNGMEVC